MPIKKMRFFIAVLIFFSSITLVSSQDSIQFAVIKENIDCYLIKYNPNNSKLVFTIRITELDSFQNFSFEMDYICNSYDIDNISPDYYCEYKNNKIVIIIYGKNYGIDFLNFLDLKEWDMDIRKRLKEFLTIEGVESVLCEGDAMTIKKSNNKINIYCPHCPKKIELR